MSEIDYQILDLALPTINHQYGSKIDLVNQSRPYSLDCQIEANNDLEAVADWLNEYASNPNTYQSYKQESLRFLMWCAYEVGKPLGLLKKQDFENYFEFLQSPPIHWIKKKYEEDEVMAWQPFKEGRLSQASLLAAVRIINSMMNYLVQAEYLKSNPVKLIKRYSRLSIDFEAQKYNVMERTLDHDEWLAIQKALTEMPEQSKYQRDNKIRTQFLFALLYILGLRIHEVPNHTWTSFKKREGRWWFFAKGKGGRKGHIPVNDQLLSYIKSYRLHLEKSADIEAGDDDYLIAKKNKDPVGKTRLYELVKEIGCMAAKYFPEDLERQQRLKKFSPHWLRHLSASHQDKLGMPMSTIKENLRHQSIQTTQIYIHSEDEQRFHEMQKLQLDNDMAVFEEKSTVIGYEFTVVLKKGPLDKVMGLSRLLDSIETKIFKDCEFQLKSGDSLSLLKEVKEQGIYCSQIVFTYRVIASEVATNPEIIERAIQRQAKVWMFDCEIKSMEMME